MRGLRRRASLIAVGMLAVAAALGASGYADAAVPAVGHDAAAGLQWTLVSSPNTSSSDNVLAGVDCVSTTFCVAAGYAFHGQVDRTLIEQWNGSTWSLVSSPNRSGHEQDILDGVSCVGTGFCMAVGYGFNGVHWQTITEEWNGTAWRLIPSPNTSSTQDNFIGGISCVSSGFCAAVGSYPATPTQLLTLAEQWNGTAWSLVSSPNQPSNEENTLVAVSCVTTVFCRAGGSYINDSMDANQTLVEKWNGVAWSLVTSPNKQAFQNNVLDGASCVSTTDCTAAGYYEFDAENAETLIESSNGRLWSLVTSPNQTTEEDNILDGVSCIGETLCVSVGSYNDKPERRTLIESWNGSAWSLTTSPNRGSKDNVLNAVSCATPTFCVAFGYSTKDKHEQTLIEQS